MECRMRQNERTNYTTVSILNVNIPNIYFELSMKDQIEERSSQLVRNLSGCEKKVWKKIQACTGFEPMTSAMPVQCSSNWVIKPTGSWSYQFVIYPWRMNKMNVNIWNIYFELWMKDEIGERSSQLRKESLKKLEKTWKELDSQIRRSITNTPESTIDSMISVILRIFSLRLPHIIRWNCTLEWNSKYATGKLALECPLKAPPSPIRK